METCRLCHESLPKKHRRTIFSDTFTVSTQLCEVLGYNVHSNDGMQKYICGYCFTKLNKLSKIEHDIAHRLEALNSERHSLLRELRSKYLKFHADARLPNVSTLNKQEEETCVPSVITPSKQHLKKHKIIHSPTPRKVKTPLTFTPTKMDTSFTTGTSQVPGKRKSINVKLFSPEKVKVLYRTTESSKIRSSIVPKGHFQRIVKNISKGLGNLKKDRISRIIYASSLKYSVNKCVLNEVKKEIIKLCSRKEMSILRNISSENLTAFHFENLNSEIQRKAPLLHMILNDVVRGSVLGTAVTAAVALKFRNMHVSAFHHILAQILDQGGATDETIDTLGKLGLSVSSSAASKKKQHLLQRQSEHTEDLLLKEKKALETTGTVLEDCKSSDIIGDNVDITWNPSQMSIDRKRKSWHWFLLVGLEKRIVNPTFNDTTPIADMNHIENSSFVPDLNNCYLLDKNIIFHIMHVLVKYVGCLKRYEKCLPKYIPHPHLGECSEKSDFVILDLLDKSENKSEDMISILELIHEHYIPKTEEDDPSVIKKKVFGGDVLTNERGYSAQLAMLPF